MVEPQVTCRPSRWRLAAPRTARFDRIARHYDWMESLLAGGKLERCRNAFWNEIPSMQSALLVGEGHGKFLASLLERNPGARVTCVDASASMLEVARNRLLRATLPLQRVEFIQAELPAWKPAAERYDLVATHFFLDCFPHEQLAEVIDNLQRAARPGGCWLISDFQIPGAGLRRLRARVIHRLMYGLLPHRHKTARILPRPSTTVLATERICPRSPRGIRPGTALRRTLETLTLCSYEIATGHFGGLRKFEQGKQGRRDISENTALDLKIASPLCDVYKMHQVGCVRRVR